MKRVLSLLIFPLLMLSSYVYAQDEQLPLLIMKFGDNTIYQYQNGVVTPLDFCAPTTESFRPATIWVSPDGYRFAFTTPGSRTVGNANNLWVCDLKARRLIAVTGQPQTQIIHSVPAWSPDGTKLAFARLIPGQNRLEFVIYDIARNNRQVIYQRDVAVSGSSFPPQVVWGAAGPVMFNVNVVGQASQTAGSEYVFYPSEFINQDKKGEAVVQRLDQYYDSIQVMIGDTPTVMSFVVSSYDNPDKVLDLATNEVTNLPTGSLVKINPLAPGAGFAEQLDMGMASQWVIGGSDYSTLLNIHAPISDSLTISPDGKQFAFITFEDYPYGGKVYVMEDAAAFMGSSGQAKLDGVLRLPEFDAYYGEAGAIGVFWGPSAIALRP